MKGNTGNIPYSAAELRWIKRHCTMPRRQAHAEFCEKFARADVSLENFKALCTRRGWRTGRDGRLQPGNVPMNKGKKMPYNERSARTQFHKGHRPHNTQYAGHERLTDDGYVEISVQETNPHTGYERRYVLKHKYLWEQQHGPVPAGMCLKCLDGNRQNAEPSNWELIARGVNALLNGRHSVGYDEAPPEVRPVVLTLAKLKYAAKCRTNGTRESSTSRVHT